MEVLEQNKQQEGLAKELKEKVYCANNKKEEEKKEVKYHTGITQMPTLYRNYPKCKNNLNKFCNNKNIKN